MSVGPTTVRRFVGRLQSASQKIQEREKAHEDMQSQFVKVKNLSKRKNITPKKLEKEYDELLNRFTAVLSRESNIIKHQRLDGEDAKKNRKDILDEIKAFENRFDQANDVIVQLNARVMDLEGKLADKEMLESRVKILKDSLLSLHNQMNDSAEREKKIEEIDLKIKDRVYQDSIRVQRIEKLISRLEEKYNKLKKSKHGPELDRIKERINSLKEKHEQLKDRLPSANHTLTYLKKTSLPVKSQTEKVPKKEDHVLHEVQHHTSKKLENPISKLKELTKPKVAVDHLYHDAKVPSFEDVLKKTQAREKSDMAKDPIPSHTEMHKQAMDKPMQRPIPPTSPNNVGMDRFMPPKPSFEPMSKPPAFPKPPGLDLPPLPPVPKRPSLWQKIKNMF